jgi:ferrous iron transport protein A
MKLSDLTTNQKAMIKNVDLKNTPMKLIEMGFLPGNQVELLLKAPFNDPLYFVIDGSHLCIRKETAMLVDVELLNDVANGN